MVSSCRCGMLVSCVHHVAVLHDLQFVNAGRADKRRTYGEKGGIKYYSRWYLVL